MDICIVADNFGFLVVWVTVSVLGWGINITLLQPVHSSTIYSDECSTIVHLFIKIVNAMLGPVPAWPVSEWKGVICPGVLLA